MAMRSTAVVVAAVALLALLGLVNAGRPNVGADKREPLYSSPDYKYYCTGNCGTDAVVSTSGGAVLMGGGPDVDNAFVWMISKSVGGDFLVIRTDDDDLYDQYIYDLGPLNSAATLVILNRAGSYESFANATVHAADAIFFAGGDQWTYYFNWKQTPMGDAIQYAITTRNVPVGGTSAGEESLGQFLYPSQFDSSVDSETALSNPYTKQIQIGSDFFTVPYLQNLICDAHFFQRDRMGRLITFVARLLNDVWAPNGALGIGVDEGTAILVDTETGIADITAWEDGGCAYFVQSQSIPNNCTPGDPLTFSGIETFRACGNTTDIFDFGTWTPNINAGNNSTLYYLSANEGELKSTQPNGHIY